jgi:hypothetical protein
MAVIEAGRQNLFVAGTEAALEFGVGDWVGIAVGGVEN